MLPCSEGVTGLVVQSSQCPLGSLPAVAFPIALMVQAMMSYAPSDDRCSLNCKFTRYGCRPGSSVAQLGKRNAQTTFPRKAESDERLRVVGDGSGGYLAQALDLTPLLFRTLFVFPTPPHVSLQILSQLGRITYATHYTATIFLRRLLSIYAPRPALTRHNG